MATFLEVSNSLREKASDLSKAPDVQDRQIAGSYEIAAAIWALASATRNVADSIPSGSFHAPFHVSKGS